ncbi:ATPase domain-containing protein [Xylophilus ampelinus]|uniref:non-specific serine/threonine protein kinase n=1 Tax=Xylophilus ampelinus TaxID=54067 RepID=A0A318SEA7_9BURK|nr:ATPase domain-containing protein [Xylophilus ampelinus]MCS4511670.1 protein kinase [Xylophilus ampelinus]PYE74186.1 circadian clock protein KaiC [Xylophilus ampelinus]
MTNKVEIRRLKTGVPGLDELLGGGLAEFSFNLIAGVPGSGKTTLAHQIMFALATPERPALFFTILGEPTIKMLRYQQQYDFFDLAKVGDCIHFVNLADEAMTGDFDKVLARIVSEMSLRNPAFVMVDSFRSVVQAVQSGGPGTDLRLFVQRLGMHLTTWQATSFLIGEYLAQETEANPIFTVADGILWMTQNLHGNSMVRKIQIAKMRGHASIPGQHTFRIGNDGIRVFPRILPDTANGVESRADAAGRGPAVDARLSMGVPVLDDMMGGGLPPGYSLLVSGPSGSGKSQLAVAFLAAGVAAGERGVIAAFEKTPQRAHKVQLDRLVASGDVGMVDTRALDLSIDETLYALTDLIERTGARRVVIDSLSGFELSLAPMFREDFRESLHRMVAVLTGMGVAVLLISELEDRYTDLRFSPYGAAFLTDAIIVQRYVELEGRLERVLAVVKVRNSAHSHELRRFQITDDGMVIGTAVHGIDGLLSGHPRY